MDDILGYVNKNKINLNISNIKIKNDDLYVFIKGDIYNKKDIIKKYNLNKKIKTENLIKILYSKYYLNFANELDGNFAIVICDFTKNQIHLVKDKLGNIFLYYYFKDNQFIFSTSLKLIMDNSHFEKIVDLDALSIYLGYTYIYEPYTIFKNAYKVKKGSIITFENNNIKENIYFDLFKQYKKIKKIRFQSEETIIKNFNNLFIKSILKGKNKNQQVGVLLSSGKDSSLLAKLCTNNYKKKINTYTLGFNNKVKNEADEATKIASYIGSNHHTYILDENQILSTIKKIPKIYFEPFSDTSILPSTYLFDHIKDKNDFLISGDGCDNLFISDDIYNIYNFKNRKNLRKKKKKKNKKNERTYKTLDEYSQINIVRRFNYSDRLINRKGQVYKIKRSIFVGKLRSAAIAKICNDISEKYRYKMFYLSQYSNNEIYTPFYDLDIILETFRIPTKKICYKGKGKYIFDKVLYKNFPKEYFETYEKRGFGIPLEEWMDKYFIKEIKKISTKEYIEKQKIFCYDELNKLIDDYSNVRHYYSQALVLWNYYIFQLWYQENIEDL